MTAKSYAAALSAALIPLGFVRNGRDWVRVRDQIEEVVNLQTSTIAGTTANLEVTNLDSARLVDEILGKGGRAILTRTKRIGHLIDGYDRWWLRDPNGPEELAEAVRVYGLPYLEKMRFDDDRRARTFQPEGPPGRWNGPGLISLAITLYRLGELEKARAVLRRPNPKTAHPAWIEHVDKVRTWLERQ